MLYKTLFATFIILFVCSLSYAQTSHTLKVSVNVDKTMKEAFVEDGRLYLFISEAKSGEPRRQTWPRGNNHIFAQNLQAWDTDQMIYFDSESELDSNGSLSLADFPDGDYRVQVLWDQNTTASSINAPGNLYSEVVELKLRDDQKITLSLNQSIAPRKQITHPLLREHSVKSDSLSAWWGKEMQLEFSVLLPRSFESNPNKKYPIIYEVGGYGSRHYRASRLVQRDSVFMAWWNTDAPEVIIAFLDGKGPYGDSYQLDSDNSGPYGFVLTQEMAPWIEKEYRAIGTTETRFVEGCSTGGWVSLALQLYYPDFFGGTYSYSPDPVDFHHMQLVNLYKDENAFVNRYGNERPSNRTTTGDPIFSIKKEIYYENVQGVTGTYTTSGEQWGAWNALYSPKGEDGLPAQVFDPQTGEIDSAVVAYWQRYDLLHHTQSNWETLGPKLEGKLWIWMGDMDNYYLNNALHPYADFLSGTTNPASDAKITFTPMQGHCRLFSRKEVIEMVGERLK
ncbi:MAG: alpha/beta hydrolase-fold protein [Bacteroidia bacterium]